MFSGVLEMLNLLAVLSWLQEAPEEAPEGADGGVGEELMEDPVGLIGGWLDQAKVWLEDNGGSVALKAAMFIVILLLFKILAGVLGGVTRKTLSTSKLNVSDLLKNFFVNVVTKLTFFVGLFIALGNVGVNVGPLLAGVGVLGFVIGMALQDTMSNFAAGIMILLYRPYDIGDVVTAGGVTGKVTAMSLVSTTFLTPDNQVQIVPNGSIWGSVITNVTAQDTRRVDLTVGVSYDDDLDKTTALLMKIAKAHPLVLEDPEPVVKVSNLGDSSVDFIVRPWSKTGDYWDVFFDLTKTIKQTLDAEGISFPYPQQDIHVVSGLNDTSSKAG